MFRKTWARKVTPKQDELESIKKATTQQENQKSKEQEIKTSENDSWKAEGKDAVFKPASTNAQYNQAAMPQPPPCWNSTKEPKSQTADETVSKQGVESSLETEPASMENEVGFHISSSSESEQQRSIFLSHVADAQLQSLVSRMRERTSLYKEQLIGQDGSSSEETPPAFPTKKVPAPKDDEKEEQEISLSETKSEEERYCDMKCCEFKRPPIKEIIHKLRIPESIENSDRFYILWLFLVGLAWNWSCWFIPVRWAFNFQTPDTLPYWLTMDYICDFIYLLDMSIFQTRLQFIQHGDIISNKEEIKKNYVQSLRFKLDLASVIPFDLFYLVFDCNPLFRLNRLLKMRDIIGKATANLNYYQNSIDNTMNYMNAYSVSKYVQNRVRKWYEHTWESQGQLASAELLESMPVKMQLSIAIDQNYAIVSKVDLFKECDKQMAYDILLKLKSVVYLPGDFVYKKGDVGREMYIIKSGQVQVLGGPDDNKASVTLKAGSVFGEISLLAGVGGNRRTANVIASGFTNLFILDKKTLNEILVNYPDSQKVLKRKARKLFPVEKDKKGQDKNDAAKGSIFLIDPKQNTPKLFNVLKLAVKKKGLTLLTRFLKTERKNSKTVSELHPLQPQKEN
ncbi:cyclic nucleotide-gated cation channel beta-1-like isoform X3 [Stegostoma tigrinum]|uniref:cyclic nucleotide-gated cation channel beta-1-like isoform X3 n=1 Tax=Stegostoma tigrinum TaxID=3053191 RepID=UPI00202B7A05|nr:cyclic nucleotide-gated cation channel beta-1-like isoform X3 [Stegostoma tigrinum]